MPELTKRQQIVLAALAAKGEASFAPVQVQKLFFLLDQKVPKELGGTQFNFEPYDYGPFDRDVYDELAALARSGYVTITSTGSSSKREYALTARGAEKGQKTLKALPERAQKYMSKTSSWVRSLSFAQLVGAIYKEFPAMRARSVFRD